MERGVRGDSRSGRLHYKWRVSATNYRLSSMLLIESLVHRYDESSRVKGIGGEGESCEL